MEPLVRERTPYGYGNATKFYSLDLRPKQHTDHKSRRKNWSVNITLYQAEETRVITLLWHKPRVFKMKNYLTTLSVMVSRADGK